MVTLLVLLSIAPGGTEPAVSRTFLERHCADCHEGPDPDGGLDVKALGADLGDPETATRWVRIFDRVQHGEMPPRRDDQPSKTVALRFLRSTGDWLKGFELQRRRTVGRVQGRRLTNLQLERTLHDLLGIDVPLAVHFPDAPRSQRYSTVADGQPMSRYQLEQHLAVVDLALDEAFRRAQGADNASARSLDAGTLSRKDPKARNREPELIDGRGVVWSAGLEFYGRIPATTAKENGWYRVTIRASALKSPKKRGVWCTVRRGHCVSGSPQLGWVGSFEARPETREWTFETWLPRGEMLEIRPYDVTLKRASFKGGQVGAGEGGPQEVPGVAIESIRMERIHRQPGPAEIRNRLIGDDLRGLVTRFAERAFRRPVTTAEVAPYFSLVEEAVTRGEPQQAALRGAYRAILCSPRFLYLYEQPGRLDDHAVASRLSYFLWNRMPDAELLWRAGARQLRRPAVLRAQVRRMLADARGKDFVRDFGAEWLDLGLIDFTEPDRRLYKTFDVLVQHGMLAETHAFLQAMVAENLSVTHVVDARFTFLNSRLAHFYGLEGAPSDEQLRRVELPPGSRRGGLLTQGAILKVTANGTNTSPVIRGVWVSERLLGEEVPPPPPNVPAIEPDIRGAKSMREMLDKHRSDKSCASCHAKIDPPGFALENFDAAGLWREVGESAALTEFRTRALGDPEKLARNVAQQLLVYATGAPVGFADREIVAGIASNTQRKRHGFASLIEEVVMSERFLHK